MVYNKKHMDLALPSFPPAHRLQKLIPYAFAEVERIKAELKKKGIAPIDFGVGDPTDPTPQNIRNAIKKGLNQHAQSGYPSYIGMISFRQAVAEWMKKRFGVSLDPETEITSSIGSKEAIFHFPLGFVNPGDYVIMPSPGYPPYKTGTLFAGGIPYFYPLFPENDFFPDFQKIPAKIAGKAKILWLNYPNSPTGQCATTEFFQKALRFAEKYNLIIASDECYSEIYFEKKPHSILEYGKKNVVVFQSLSKRSCMTGHRIGWVCGDRDIIKVFRTVKTNIDSGTPNFIQEGAMRALSDETHVRAMNQRYRQKRDILLSVLQKIGLQTRTPEATFYLWQRVPNGETSLSFAKKLLQDKIAIVTTPGQWISDECRSINPGEKFIRFALVPSINEVKIATKRLLKNPNLVRAIKYC